MGVRLSGARIQKNWAVFHWNVGPSDKLSAMTKIAFKEAICQTLNASPSFKTHIAKSKVHGRHNFSECFEQPHFGQKESSMLNSTARIFLHVLFWGQQKKNPPLPNPTIVQTQLCTVDDKATTLEITLHPNREVWTIISFRFISFHVVLFRKNHKEHRALRWFLILFQASQGPCLWNPNGQNGNPPDHRGPQTLNGMLKSGLGKDAGQFGKASHDRKTGTCKDIVYNIPMRAATSSEMNPNRMFKIHISSIVQLSIEIILYALYIFIILVYSPFSLPSLSKTSVTSVQSSCRDQHCVVSQASSIGTITIIPSVKCNLSLFQSKLVIDARFELWSTVCSPCFLCGEA